MLLVYLLLFLLSASASCCHATSRNHRLLPAAVPASPPATASGDHRTTMHVFWSPNAHAHAAATAMGKQESPPKAQPDIELLSGALTTSTTAEQEDAAATVPFPAADGGYTEVGGEGGDRHERAVDDAGVDYSPPKTHPPSHN
ncbi:hypothetical protein ABZP36_024885 [Zizania latifolia]